MKSQLLATFTTKDNLDDTIKKIVDAYTIIFSKVYVLQNENNVNELICTYNVDTQGGVDYNKVEGTISLHRKKIIRIFINEYKIGYMVTWVNHN